MIAAIRRAMADGDFSGRVWKSADTCVWQQHAGVAGTPSYLRTIDVILNDTTIGTFDVASRELILTTAGWHTATTCSRLKALAQEFCPGWSVFRRKGMTYVRRDSWSAGECEAIPGSYVLPY